MQIETRSIEGIEIRSEEGQPVTLYGYAAVYDSVSKDLGGFVEVIRRGAFARSLAENEDILALAHHDVTKVLGRRSVNTLRIKDDERGIFVEVTPSNSTAARDIVEDVRSRNINAWSFRFKTVKDRIVKRAGELPLRELLEVKLREVSPVSFPAYNDTTLFARSLDEIMRTAERPDDGPDRKSLGRIYCARLRLLTS